MQPLEKYLMTDDTPETERDAVAQLAFAYRRSEEALTEGASEALVEGIRRAEAILFAAGEPLSAEQIAETLPHGVEAAEVLMALRAQYVNRGVNLVEVAGKWRFQTASDLSYLFVEERQGQKKLGQATLETLAIIAYHQPVTRAEIEEIRGVSVSRGTVDQLLEMEWIRFGRRKMTPGRPVTFVVTQEFLAHFRLESPCDLPGLKELRSAGLLENRPAFGAMPTFDIKDEDEPEPTEGQSELFED